MSIDTGIRIMNTLGGKLTPLMMEEGKPIRTYTCGPTVYSTSHMGHARTYIVFDMIRRVMTDYFNLPVQWSMNITNVDDKIIDDFNKHKDEYPGGVEEFAKVKEDAFWRDMDRVNVRRPDSILRVTEVMPEIIAFVKDLVDKGFAYPSNGSVYFDVKAYVEHKGPDGKPMFVYSELEPKRFNPEELAENPNWNKPKPTDHELTEDELFALEKKHSADFALWKKAKPGEPFWDTEWGPGRPGWHIECSTMSSLFYGKQFDIHLGGTDLRFPHHTNEIAQSQAHHGVVPWVKIWMHAGHLNKQGVKISKSLGNFSSVASALETHSWQQYRLAFARTPYQSPMEMTDDILAEAGALWNRIQAFLSSCEALRSTGKMTSDVHGYTENDNEFSCLIGETAKKIHQSFANNFDIPSAFNAVEALINAVYAKPPHEALRVSAARLVKNFISVLGFVPESVSTAQQGTSLGPIAQAMAESRRSSRDNAKELLNEAKAVAQVFGVDLRKPRPEDPEMAKKYDLAKSLLDHAKEALNQLDLLRDEILPTFGIKLEDGPEGTVSFKIGEPETAEDRKKKRAQAQHQAEVAKQQKAQPKKEKAPVRHPYEELTEKGYLFFKKVGEEEVPITGPLELDAKGNPIATDLVIRNKDNLEKDLSKSEFKKVLKLYANGMKVFEKQQKSQA